MPNWVEAYNMTRAAMARSNGVGAGDVPRVKNQEAASILRVTMHNATRLKLPANLTARWYEVALALAGWRQPGDKFLVTPAHRNALLSDAATAVLWQLALNVAMTAQNRGDAFIAPTMNPPADYDVVLKQAWAKMLADRAPATPAPANPLPSPATSPATAPDVDDETDGAGSGLIWLIILYAVGSGKV